MASHVIDLIVFGYEIDMLEGRLITLSPYVDLFVIVESDRTHTGAWKGYVFEQHKDRFEEYREHIIYFKVKGGVSPDPWINERFHRQQCLEALLLTQHHPESLVFYCDTDEWWDPRNISDLGDELCALNMRKFNYSVWWFQGMEVCAIAGPAKSYIDHDLYDLKFVERARLPVLENGWHFTSMGDWPNLSRKLDSYSHSELSSRRWKRNMYGCWKYGYDLQGHPFEQALESDLPDWISQRCAPESWYRIRSRVETIFLPFSAGLFRLRRRGAKLLRRLFVSIVRTQQPLF